MRILNISNTGQNPHILIEELEAVEFSALGESVEMEGATGAEQELFNPIYGGSPITSARTGNWSSGSTWVGGVVPGADDDFQILHAVTVDGTGRTGRHGVIEDSGTLIFANNSELSVATLIVNGTSHEDRGHLKMGDANSPITATLIIRDVAVDPVGDPWQFWGGVNVVNYGKWTMHGVVRNVRSLYFEAAAGATTVDLFDLHSTLDRHDFTIGADTVSLLTLPADPTDGVAATLTGWAIGDRLFFPGTLALEYSSATSAAAIGAEWRTIASIDGNTVTLNAALTYNHFGQTSTIDGGNISYYPVIQNLTRSITIKSEDPAGVRGHTLVSHRAQIDRRYAAFEDMGRSVPTTEAVEDEAGSIRGRYPIHNHHLHGPVGGISNSVDGAADGYGIYDYGLSAYNTVTPGHVTWLAAVHDVSFGYMGYCDFNWYYGAALITEEGIEVENVFEHNRAMFGTGDGGRLDQQGTDDPGLAGSALWFRGPGNYVRFNVAANAFGAGPYQWGMNTYCHFLQSGEFAQVKFQTEVGQDRHDEGELRYANAQNYLQNEGNYLFSCSGLHTAWSIATWSDTLQSGFDGPGGTVDDLLGWNSYGYGVFLYEHHQVVHRKNVVLAGTGTGQELLSNDYRLTEVDFEDCFFEGIAELPSYTEHTVGLGSLEYGTVSFTNCIFNRATHTTLHGNGGGQFVPGREITLDSCVFLNATDTLWMAADLPEQGRQDVRDITVVLNYRRAFADPAGDSFRVQPTYRPALPNPLADRSEIGGDIYELP
jgi:hypothetical protein